MRLGKVNFQRMDGGRVMLYPQVQRNSLQPFNPQGCFDWWGYDDPDYVRRRGTQVSAVRDRVRTRGLLSPPRQ